MSRGEREPSAFTCDPRPSVLRDVWMVNAYPPMETCYMFLCVDVALPWAWTRAQAKADKEKPKASVGARSIFFGLNFPFSFYFLCLFVCTRITPPDPTSVHLSIAHILALVCRRRTNGASKLPRPSVLCALHPGAGGSKWL
jgi:hypothetical protein